MGKKAREFRTRMAMASLSMSLLGAVMRYRRNSVDADFDAVPAATAGSADSGAGGSVVESVLSSKVEHGDESTPAFPPRAARLKALESTHYDMLVVGGGAVGLYTALDASTRGLKVALVDAHDFGAGRSGNTIKMVQSGVHDFQRALRRRDIHLLAPALERQQEFATLARVAPRLVEHIDCVMPVFRFLESAELSLCAFVAAFMTATTRGVTRVRLPQLWSGQEVLDAYPDVQERTDEGGVRGAVVSDGAVINDTRLAVEVANKASRSGATLVNHCRVVSCETQRVRRPTSYNMSNTELELYSLGAAYQHWRKGDKMSPDLLEEAKGVAARHKSKEHQELENNVDRFVAAVVRDELTGRDIRIEADVLVNCAGRWSDTIREMVCGDFSDRCFANFSSLVSYVVPRVTPDVIHGGQDAPDKAVTAGLGASGPEGGAARRRVLSVAGAHINSQRFFVTPHPGIPGASIVGAVDALQTDEPGARMDRGVEPPQPAHTADIKFLQQGLDIYGLRLAEPSAVIAPVTSLFGSPNKQPQLIPNAIRYETAIDMKHTDAHMITPYGATWLDARLVAEKTVTAAWTEVLFRKGDLAAFKPRPVEPCVTTRIGIASEVEGGPAAPASREQRLGTAGSAAVKRIEEADSRLTQPLVPSVPFLSKAEALYSLRHEGAETALDVLRRAGAIDFAAAGCLAELPAAVSMLGAELGWSKSRRSFELETGQAFIEGHVPPRA
jgi:glycerol-3-phosphate dehydrogenase